MRAYSVARPRPPDQRARLLSTEPSTEPLAHEAPGADQAAARCSACNGPIAADQRYCLECGERLAPISGFLMGRGPTATQEQPTAPPDAPPAPNTAAAPRSTLLGVLAGVGVLLLAMGVGVLIGRAGNSQPAAAKPEVITEPAPTAASGSGSTEAAFTSDWPASRSGYTVQLSTLPSSSSVAAVTAAKAAAGAKGAPAVGALASGEFPSLPSGSYVIYSGVFHSAGQAHNALAGLRAKFPGAKVIHVSGGGSGGGGSGAGSSHGGSAGGSKPAAPSSITHPAKVPNTLKGKGQNYEKASQELPEVVETQ